MVLKTRRHVEAPPERPRAVPQQRPSRPVGIGGTVVAELIAADAPDTAPLPLTDWSARLADDWTHVESNLDDLGASIVREASRTAARNQYSVHVLAAPLLSELTELTAVQLPEWRKALRVHAEAELALYDTESEASL